MNQAGRNAEVKTRIFESFNVEAGHFAEKRKTLSLK